MAEFAAQHADAFDRIDLIVVEDEEITRLNVNDERWRRRVRLSAGGDVAALKALLEDVRAAQ